MYQGEADLASEVGMLFSVFFFFILLAYDNSMQAGIGPGDRTKYIMVRETNEEYIYFRKLYFGLSC